MTGRDQWGFAHLYPNRVEVYGPRAEHIHTHPLQHGPLPGLITQAVEGLTAAGYIPAREGWRRPLDPRTGIIATCALPPAGDTR